MLKIQQYAIIYDQYFRSNTAIIPESCLDPLTETQFEKPNSSSKTSFSQNSHTKPSTNQFCKIIA